MNKKILGSVAAIVAVLALVAGGTFAAWSDFSTKSTGADAGILKLNVSSTGGAGATEALGFGNLAPGENKVQEVFIASSDGASVPNATLTMTLENLVNSEDNPACTTNSEDVAENGSLTGACAAPGEFGAEAVIQILSKPAVAGSCAGGGYGVIAGSAVNNVPLNSVENDVLTLDADVAAGEGRCVRLELKLPNGMDPGGELGNGFDATNASQGDESDFDITFDLIQNV